MTISNQQLQAEAGVSILRSKWLDASIGVTGSSSLLRRFTPAMKGVFQLKFW